MVYIFHSLEVPLTLTRCFLEFRKLYMKFEAFLVKPYASSLAINSSLFKQSNASERSTKIAPVLIFLSNAFLQFSTKNHRASCVLCPSLKPQIRGFRKVLAYGFTCFSISLSNILDIGGKTEIGL